MPNPTATYVFTVRDGRITHIVEYWPERYDPATKRAHLTDRIE